MTSNIYFSFPAYWTETATATIPLYIIDAVKGLFSNFCRKMKELQDGFLKKHLQKKLLLTIMKWFTIHKAEEELITTFLKQKNYGTKKILRSSVRQGCPGNCRSPDKY